MSKKATKSAIAAAINEAPANPSLEAKLSPRTRAAKTANVEKLAEKPKRVVKPKVVTPEPEPVIEAPIAVATPDRSNDKGWKLSTAEKPTKKVWAIAESMPGASRKAVIAACIEAGIAPGTSRTQYQAWFSAMRASGKAVR